MFEMFCSVSSAPTLNHGDPAWSLTAGRHWSLSAVYDSSELNIPARVPEHAICPALFLIYDSVGSENPVKTSMTAATAATSAMFLQNPFSFNLCCCLRRGRFMRLSSDLFFSISSSSERDVFPEDDASLSLAIVSSARLSGHGSYLALFNCVRVSSRLE